MIDGSEKRNRQLAFEPQNSHVCEKRSKITQFPGGFCLKFFLTDPLSPILDPPSSFRVFR